MPLEFQKYKNVNSCKDDNHEEKKKKHSNFDILYTFTYTNLVDPYFELRSADTVFTKLSFLKVLRRNKRFIKKIFQKAVTWVGFQLSHSNLTNLKNNHTI